jgi:hypothetical protein
MGPAVWALLIENGRILNTNVMCKFCRCHIVRPNGEKETGKEPVMTQSSAWRKSSGSLSLLLLLRSLPVNANF